MPKDRQPVNNGQHPGGETITSDTEVLENRRSRLNPSERRLLTFTMLFGIGVGAFLLGQRCGIEEARDEAVRLLGEEEFDFNLTSSERARSIDEATVRSELANWQVAKNSYQQTFAELVNYNDSEELIKPIRSMAMNHTLYGVELLSRINKGLEIGVVEEAGMVKISDLVFDLTKPLDFHLATAIIDTQITRKTWTEIKERGESVISEDVDDIIKKTESDLTYLRYLKEKADNFYFTQESFLFMPRDLLVANAKIMQVLERQGYPLPKTIMVTKAVSTDGGRYILHDSLILPFTVIIRGNSNSYGVIHEWAHFLQDASHLEEGNKEKTKRASLENFQKVVEANQLLWGKQVEDSNNQYLEEHAEDGTREDYAETMAWVFWRGDDLKTRLAELEKTDPWSYQIVKAKTDFFTKIVFEGEEFHNEGVSLSYINNEVSTIVKPALQVGDVIEIVDDDQEKSGILLRPVASYRLDNENLLAVFNGDEVEIIEGPEQVIYYDFDENGQVLEEKVNWWKVKISRQTIGSYSLVGNIEGEGWIQERWFGEEVPGY